MPVEPQHTIPRAVDPGKYKCVEADTSHTAYQLTCLQNALIGDTNTHGVLLPIVYGDICTCRNLTLAHRSSLVHNNKKIKRRVLTGSVIHWIRLFRVEY